MTVNVLGSTTKINYIRVKLVSKTTVDNKDDVLTIPSLVAAVL